MVVKLKIASKSDILSCTVEESLQKHQDGAEIFIEVGPGKVLSGLVRKTLKDVMTLHVEVQQV